MKKMMVVACLLASMTLAKADRAVPAQAAVPMAFLGELCWDVGPFTGGGESTMKLALSSAGSSWQLNGLWWARAEFPGPIVFSRAMSGVMARDVRGGGFDISLTGNDFVDENDMGSLQFHAKISSSGNGTWKGRYGDGNILGSFFNIIHC